MDDAISPWLFPVLIFLIPITAIVCSFTYLVVRTMARSRVRELEIRERIAMIERGLVPSPESDPRGFERAIARPETYVVRRGPARLRRAGITIMGLGFGLMVLIGFAGEAPGPAVGVGGSIAIIGLGFFLNSLFDGDPDHGLPPIGRYPAPPPPAPPAPAVAPPPPDQRPD